MTQSITELLNQGLIMTALGMGLAFLALGVLWGLISLLMRWPGASVPAEAVTPPAEAVPAPLTADQVADALTAERGQVAVMVAAALLANALPLPQTAPTGPTFEHGRTAPNWVSSNRARSLQSWQPLRPPVN